jgi:hypothetical protein
MLRLPWRAGPAGADPGMVAVARQQADRAANAELKLRQQQQRRAGWLEANAGLGPTYRQVVRELAWQRRARGLALEQEQPHYLRGELGPIPESTRGRRAWRQAAASQPSGPPGTTPARQSPELRSASAAPTATTSRSGLPHPTHL